MDRRLAAIFAADVVGYSRLMGQDEAGTLAAVKALRVQVIDPQVAEHKGRVFKATGDGVLAEFPSVVDAVACAVDIQRGAVARNVEVSENKSIRLRIGVNVGDVVVEGEDIFGDGVNIAARLESVAPPDGIPVSSVVREQIGNRLNLEFEDTGEHELKNIERAVRIYRIVPGQTSEGRKFHFSLPEKPSIAVLPFLNMSTDPEQEHFADGLTEDLITDLSRNAGLFVIARNSTFAYKGKATAVRSISRDLGVRYLLEDSARRVGERVRINVQRIDAIGGGHLWAERFDRSLEDIFAVQDEVTAKIVEALVGRLVKPLPRNRPKSIDAYNLCVRARPLMEQSPQAASEARMLLERAIALDPDYAEAHALLAQNLWLHWVHFGAPENPTRSLSLTLAQRAVSLDPNDAGCHSVLGLVFAYEFRWAESDTELAAAVALDTNNADAWANLSDITTLSGRISDGLDQIQRALRLNPHPESWYYLLLGQAQYAARDYEAAVETLRIEDTYRTNSRKFLAASLAQLGRIVEARQEAEMFLVGNPHWTIGHWAATQPIRDETVREDFVAGFRKAGLPE